MTSRRILSWQKFRIYWDPCEWIVGTQTCEVYRALYLGYLSIYWWRSHYYWKGKKG